MSAQPTTTLRKSAPETLIEAANIIANNPQNLEQLKQYPQLFVKMPLQIDPVEIDYEANPDELSDDEERATRPGVVGSVDFLFK